MSDQNDRRRKRSENPQEALALQLRHVADELGLEAMVLADDLGQPVAQVGDGTLSSVLAESAMWADFGDADVDLMTLRALQAIDPDVGVSDIVSERVDVPGEASLRLLALGRGLVGAIAVQRAARGVERIRTTLH